MYKKTAKFKRAPTFLPQNKTGSCGSRRTKQIRWEKLEVLRALWQEHLMAGKKLKVVTDEARYDGENFRARENVT